MVWGTLLSSGYVLLKRLEGRVDSRKYIQMPSEVKPFLDAKYQGNKDIIQQDNCSIHKSKMTLKWFHDNEMDVLPWPAKSPDLNIIENVWHLLEKIIYEEKQYNNKNQLWQAILQAADKLMNEKKHVLDALFNGMNKRLLKVIDLGGEEITGHFQIN